MKEAPLALAAAWTTTYALTWAHEGGHYAAGKAFGYKPLAVEVPLGWSVGGATWFDGADFAAIMSQPWQAVVINGAGPAAHLVASGLVVFACLKMAASARNPRFLALLAGGCFGAWMGAMSALENGLTTRSGSDGARLHVAVEEWVRS